MGLKGKFGKKKKGESTSTSGEGGEGAAEAKPADEGSPAEEEKKLDASEDGPDPGIFKSLRERRCTDVCCLLFLIIMWVVLFFIAAFSIAYGDINYLRYPTDYLGQFCGMPGSNVSDRPYSWYSQLNTDITNQLPILMAHKYWKFRAYALCVPECPGAFSLENPMIYGGPSYPGAEAGAPTYYSGFRTVDYAKRCFPTKDNGMGAE